MPGERRRPTEAPKPAALLPSSPQDRIQEIRGGPQWEGRREGGGRGKGAVAAAAHTGSALGTARTGGGSAGEAVPARTPRGSQPRVRGPGGGARSDGWGSVSGGERPGTCPRPRLWGCRGVVLVTPRPRHWACARLRGFRGSARPTAVNRQGEVRGCGRSAQGLSRRLRPPGRPKRPEAEGRGSGCGGGGRLDCHQPSGEGE